MGMQCLRVTYIDYGTMFEDIFVPTKVKIEWKKFSYEFLARVFLTNGGLLTVIAVFMFVGFLPPSLTIGFALTKQTCKILFALHKTVCGRTLSSEVAKLVQYLP